MIWKTQDWASQGRRKHVKTLKEELKNGESEVLLNHLRQLKKAWGVRIRLPKQAA